MKMHNHIFRSFIFTVALSLLGKVNPIAATAWNIGNLKSGTYTLTTKTSGSTIFVVNGTSYEYIGVSDNKEAINIGSGKNIIIELNTSEPVPIRGQINVETGASLTIKLGDAYQCEGGSVKRWSDFTEYIIYNKGGTVTITGNAKKHFIIDGMGNMKVTGSNEGGYTAVNQDRETSSGIYKTVNAKNALLKLAYGTSTLDFVDLVNNYNDNTSETDDAAGGAINAYGYSSVSTAKLTITLNNCTIKDNYSEISGAAFYICGIGKGSEIKLTDCTIQNNFNNCNSSNNPGGIIRTFSLSTAEMTMTNCKIRDNKGKNYSGGILWNSSEANLTLDNCELYNNWCGDDGGAMQIMTTATLKGCDIHDNYAKGSGGGISVKTFNSGTYRADGLALNNGIINLDSETKIHDNTAERNGGGINFHVRRIVNNDQKKTSGKPRYSIYYNYDNEQYQISLNINGTAIYNNTAHGNGGAISINRTTRIYDSNLTVNSGQFYNNTAVGKGGAIYINSNDSEDNDAGAAPVKNRDGSSNVSNINWTSLKAQFGNEGNVSDLRMFGNTATEGGAVYVEGNYHSTDVLQGIFGDQTLPNKANGGNGGAFYIKDGNFKLTDGTISYNTSVNGGGVYVDGGNVDFINGSVMNNIATGNGGGAYVSGGTVTFFSGNLKGNTAMNGGGLYLASQATMTFKGGIISGNSAVVWSESGATTAYKSGAGTGRVEGCGGGIYLASGTDGHVTSLNFDLLSGTNSFGLYSNLAEKGGDDLVSEGDFTSIVLPDVSEMSLAGFEGKDANPDWYEDYFTDDTSYDKGTNVRPASIKRYRDLLNEASDEFSYHRIPLGTGTGQINPTSIANKYLSLTLGYQSLKFTLKVTGLVGEECAKFLLRRHGAEGNNTDYDLLFSADDDAENPGTSTKVFANMAWGDYSILPVESWNWAYDPVTPVVNIHIANTWEYEHTFEMKHRNNSQIPLHEEHNVAL